MERREEVKLEMPQVPLPRVSLSSGTTPQYAGSPGVTPVGDVAGKQAQQLGAALTKFGKDVGEISVAMNEEQALASAKKGLNQQAEFSSMKMIAYEGKVGEEAVEVDKKKVAPQVIKDIEDKMKEIEDGMSSGLAKQMFRQAAEKGMVGVKSRVWGHEAKQNRIWTLGETAASIDQNSLNAIELHGKDEAPPEVSAAGQMNATKGTASPPVAPVKKRNPPWRQAYDDAITETREWARDMGLGKDKTKQVVLERKTAINAGIADKYLKGENAKAAKEFLKSLKAGDMDSQTSMKLNAQVDKVLRAERVQRMATDIFDRGGQSKEEWRKHRIEGLPKEKQVEIGAAGLFEIKEELDIPALRGMSAEQVKDVILNPKEWHPGVLDELKGLLGHPQVIARLEEKFATLDDDILKARYPGQPSATDPSTGSYKRMLDQVKQKFDKGEIDADERIQMERTIDEYVRRSVVVRNATDGDILDDYEEFLQEQKEQKESMDFDSAGFRVKHPDLYQSIVDQGLQQDARALSEKVYKRQFDPDKYIQAETAYFDGKLEGLSFEELKNTYYSFLDRTGWNAVVGMWTSAQPEPVEAAKAAKVENNLLVSTDEALRKWCYDSDIFTGVIDSPKGKSYGPGQNLSEEKRAQQASDFLQLRNHLDKWIKTQRRPKGVDITVDELLEEADRWKDRKVYTVRKEEESSALAITGGTAGAGYGAWRWAKAGAKAGVTKHPLVRGLSFLGWVATGSGLGELADELLFAGSLDATQERLTNLDAREEAARRSGDEDAIATVKAERQSTFRKVGGQNVYVRPVGAFGRSDMIKGIAGMDNGRVPPRAAQFIRDEWRLGELEKGVADNRLTLKQFDFLKGELEKLGAKSLGHDLSKKEVLGIDQLFSAVGLGDAWPTIEGQVRDWRRLRPTLAKDLVEKWGLGITKQKRRDAIDEARRHHIPTTGLTSAGGK